MIMKRFGVITRNAASPQEKPVSAVVGHACAAQQVRRWGGLTLGLLSPGNRQQLEVGEDEKHCLGQGKLV